MKSQELAKKIDKSVVKILKFLKSEFNDHSGFKGRSFYGETFTTATLALREEDEKWQKELLEVFKHRDKLKPAHHEEFNNFAILEYLDAEGSHTRLAESQLKPHKQLFLRKVSNWVLLRNLVWLKRGGFVGRVKSAIQSSLILKFNREEGYITDNTLRSLHKRKTSISSQYHAFANLLMYLIAKEQDRPDMVGEFLRGLEPIAAEQKLSGELNLRGRGKKQIFGYGVILYSFALAYHITEDKDFLKALEKGFKFLSAFQETSGQIPLVLVKDKILAKQYYYSYNNDFDYLPFLAFWLQKTVQLLNLE